MAFNVIPSVSTCGIPSAELHNELMMGMTKNKTKRVPKTKEISMNGDFSFSQTKLSAHSSLHH